MILNQILPYNKHYRKIKRSMSKACVAILAFVLFVLMFLFELIMLVFILPIKGQCDFNEGMPPDASLDLSMEQWIRGAMGAGIIMFALFFGSSRSETGSQCWSVFLTIMFVLYHMFQIVWSILGLIIFSNDFYSKKCSYVDDYDLIINMGIYSGLACSIIFLIVIIFLLCLVCRKEKRAADQPLLDPQEPNVPQVSNQQIRQQQRVKLNDNNGLRMQPLTDAEEQRRRNIYQQMYHKIVGTD